ncbi:MAG: hypothetical protein ABIJ09_04930 [Pseudomonadota bacterium]
MQKLTLVLLAGALGMACVPSITPGQKVEGTIDFADNAKQSNATDNTYYSDTYRLGGAKGDRFHVELWADDGARMNLEQVREEGTYPEDICSASGEGHDDGEAELKFDGDNFFNVYLIDQDMTEKGVGYSFLFTAR